MTMWMARFATSMHVNFANITSFSFVGNCQVTGLDKNVNYVIKARKCPCPKENQKRITFTSDEFEIPLP